MKISGGGLGYGAGEGDRGQDRSISTPWFHFVHAVMKLTQKDFPDHRFATNGYANRDIPPEIPAGQLQRPANLVLMFADIGACSIHRYDDPKCFQMATAGRDAPAMGKALDKVWIYNYNYTMLVGKGTIVPMVQRLRRDHPFLKKAGIFGFHDQDEADMARCRAYRRGVRVRAGVERQGGRGRDPRRLLHEVVRAGGGAHARSYYAPWRRRSTRRRITATRS